ncbi:MAG: hypothetical protein IJW33_02495 [Lentisphaeria bacterium]|nr:hypothetical protein [Lentisphaeria bacterium]
MSYPVPVMEIGGNRNNGSGWEILAAMNGMNNMNGMNCWWPLLFLLFGWGGYGFGGGFGGGFGRGFGGFGGCGGFGGNALADLAVADATNIAELKAGANFTAQTVNGIRNAIGDVKDLLCNQFANINNNITSLGYQTQLGQRDLQAGIADCCCKTQTSIANSTNAITQQLCQLNYNQAMQTCELKQAIAAEGAATRQLLLDQETERLRTALAKAEQENFMLKNCRDCDR